MLLAGLLGATNAIVEIGEHEGANAPCDSYFGNLKSY